MARYILPVASVMVVLVCAAVLWSSAFAAPKGIEVRYLPPAAPAPNPAVAETSSLPAAIVAEATVWSMFDSDGMTIVVTDALVRASDEAPFAHRNPLGAPRLPAHIVGKSTAELVPDELQERWDSTFTTAEGASVQMAEMSALPSP